MATTATLGGLTLVIVIFVLIVAVLWILLPFLVMGSNKRLDKVIAGLEEQNRLQRQTITELEQRNRAS